MVHKQLLVGGAAIAAALVVFSATLVGRAHAQEASASESNSSQQTTTSTGKGGVVTATAGGRAQAGGAASAGGVRWGTAAGSGEGQARDPSKKLFLIEFVPAVQPARNVQPQSLNHDMHLAKAARDGTVLLAGPLEDGVEGVLAQFAEKAQAVAFAQADPGVRDGSVRVLRLREWAVTHDNLGGRRVVTVPGPGKPPRGGG